MTNTKINNKNKTPKTSSGTEEIEQENLGEQSHGGTEGEVSYGYGRQGGSIASTGTRTDVPVGIEQVESSENYKVSPKQALERQGHPNPRTFGSERGVAGPTEDDISDQRH